MPQKSAIWSKVNEVFSTSQTAVALGMSGRVIEPNLQNGRRSGPSHDRKAQTAQRIV
jgi:hypothetical protein